MYTFNEYSNSQNIGAEEHDHITTRSKFFENLDKIMSTEIPVDVDEETRPANTEEGEQDMRAEEQSIVKHLLGQVRWGMSLERITLPTFILETRSTIERLTDWMVHADILRDLNDEEDPCLRCLHLCRWVVSGFHLGPKTPKKPYNPLLGECFRSAVLNKEEKVCGTYVAEQVSHHPPISAFHYQDREGGAVIWGHTEIRSQFVRIPKTLKPGIAAIMDNENTMVNFEHLKRGETYKFNLPDMYGRGIFGGPMRMEICGSVRVVCPQTKVKAKITFYAKSIWHKRYDLFEGEIYDTVEKGSKEKKVLMYKFQGQWSSTMTVTRVSDNHSWVAFDVEKNDTMRMEIPADEDQSAYESRHMWSRVSHYLKRNDSTCATEHKLALERRQRGLVKYLKDNKVEWELQRFHFDQEQKRYVPNDLNLRPMEEGEAPMQMPEPFHLPRVAERLESEGVMKTLEQVQEEAEQAIASMNE